MGYPKHPPPPANFCFPAGNNKLFCYTGGTSSIPPRPAPHPPTSTYHPPSYPAPLPPTSPTDDPPPEDRGSESPVPVKPARRKTKKGAAPPPPLTSHPPATDVSSTENNVCILGILPDNQCPCSNDVM